MFSFPGLEWCNLSGIELQMILNNNNKDFISRGIVLKALLKILAEVELKPTDHNSVGELLNQGDKNKSKHL